MALPKASVGGTAEAARAQQRATESLQGSLRDGAQGQETPVSLGQGLVPPACGAQLSIPSDQGPLLPGTPAQPGMPSPGSGYSPSNPWQCHQTQLTSKATTSALIWLCDLRGAIRASVPNNIITSNIP